jgi:hypothetical protein
MHLSAEELVDIAEGTRLESSAPHLAGCTSCRTRLTDLRTLLSAAQDVEVPEPSPLFWDHLSSRVSQAVAMEEAVAGPARLKGSRAFAELLRGGWGLRSSFGARAFQVCGARAFQASVAVAAGVLIAVALSSRAPAPAPYSSVVPTANTGAATELLGDVADDASLTLVASLTDEADLETVREAGLAPRGSAEHALAHMSDGELRELGRLLKEELARPGA